MCKSVSVGPTARGYRMKQVSLVTHTSHCFPTLPLNREVLPANSIAYADELSQCTWSLKICENDSETQPQLFSFCCLKQRSNSGPTDEVKSITKGKPSLRAQKDQKVMS